MGKYIELNQTNMEETIKEGVVLAKIDDVINWFFYFKCSVFRFTTKKGGFVGELNYCCYLITSYIKKAVV